MKVKKNNKPAKKIIKPKPVTAEPVKDDVTTGGEPKPLKQGKVPVLLRGMKDILPKEEHLWKQFSHTAEHIADAYEYGRIETPLIEEATLFTRSIGKGTDVVEKEMYVFEDRDGTKVSLRPEATASVVRSYISHGLHSLPQPVKVWYQGAMFRHDRPQAGRFRQFHQFGCEVLGERNPVIDAELIVVAYNFLRDLGIDSQVKINSIGKLEERERYVVELLGYLRSKRSYLPEEIKLRMHKNPLRVLDSKEEEMKPILDEAPQIIDWLGEESKNYFMKVLEYLDDLSIPYVLTPTLVRGLDYYCDTVFELFDDVEEQGSQSALGGGGRYDSLVEQLGGRPTAAAGFAMGAERVVSAMRKRAEQAQVGVPVPKSNKVFFAQLGEQARRRALFLIEQLRREGVFVHHTLGKTSLKTQLETANKINVTHTVILGQKEVQDGTIIVRDMESGIQEIIDQKKLRQRLEKLYQPV